jgi:hypothetical protein
MLCSHVNRFRKKIHSSLLGFHRHGDLQGTFITHWATLRSISISLNTWIRNYTNVFINVIRCNSSDQN